MPGSEEKGEEAKSSGDGKPFVDSTAVAIEAGSTSASKKDALRPKNADGDQNGGVKPEPEAGRAGEDHDDEEHYNEDEDDEDGDEGNLNSKWEETFKRLQVFKERHGHCLVPNRYQEDPQLGSWVSTQRRQYKIFASGSDQSTPMTAERARRLEGIGFQWSTRDPRHVPWEKRYGELLEFIRRFGHAQVPIGWKENVQLSNWVSTQRQEYKLMQKGRTTRLTQDRIDLLNKVNFVWEAQRGGPRRHRRATVSVPPKANPVQKSAKESRGSTPSSAGRGGKGGARGGLTPPAVVARSAPASAPQPSGTAASQSPDSQPQPTGAISLGPQGTQHFAAGAGAVAGANAQMAINLSAMNAAGAFPPGSNLAGIRSLADLGMFGQPGQAMMGQPWHMLPNGAFQQQGPMGLGIFPIATPLPIAAAGYQLGMIPTSLVEGGAGAFLRHPMFAGAAAGAAPVAATTPSKSKSSKKKKRKSHGKSKKKKKKKKEEEEEEDSESEEEDEEEEEEEEDDDEESG